MKKGTTGSSAAGLMSGGNAEVLQVLFNVMQEPVFILDRQGTILLMNTYFAASLGRLPSAFVGMNVYDLLADEMHLPELAAERKAMAEKVLESGRKISFEDEQDGRLFHHTVYPLIGESLQVDQLLVIAQDITEFRQLSRILLDHKPLNNAIIDLFPGVFIMIDTDGNLVASNACFRDEVLGGYAEDLSRLNVIHDLIHPDDSACLLEHARLATLADADISTNFSVECRLLRQGASDYRWFLFSCRWIPLDGQIYGIGLGIDITGRKLMEEVLSESEERFKKAFQSHSAIMLLIDTMTAGIVDANSAASEFYGWSIEELKRMKITQIDTLPAEELKKEFVETQWEKGRKFLFNHRLSDGSLRNVEVNASIFHSNGRRYTYSIINDITDRVRADALSSFRLQLLERSQSATIEELLRISLDQAERLTGSASSFFSFTNPHRQHNVVQVWSSSMDVERHEVETSPLFHPVHEAASWDVILTLRNPLICNDFAASEFPGSSVADHPSIKRVLVVPILRDKEVRAILVMINKHALYSDDDAQWISRFADFIWDIIARKQAEEATAKIQSTLTEIQKMELVGQLAGGIAHDFNNMLSVIMGNAELLLGSGIENETVSVSLKHIYNAANRSAQLTNNLLAFARKQMSLARVIDINATVELLLDILGNLVGERCELVWIPKAGNVEVLIDPFHIDQILTNLCINARDAIPSSLTGRITITSDNVFIDESSYQQGFVKPSGAYLRLSVTDNGSGIAQDDFAHIFEPFFTTKEVGKGTGLGLSTVYGVVKQNRGFVEVDSEVGIGSTFRVYFPLYRQLVQQKETTESDGPDDVTILLVDDSPDILKLCKIMLENNGYRVMTAGSPSEAIRITEEHRGEIDLLLTDVMMPEMNGKELSRRLSLMRPNMAILFMSGYSADILALQGLNADGQDLIGKPFTLALLLGRIKAVLHEKHSGRGR